MVPGPFSKATFPKAIYPNGHFSERTEEQYREVLRAVQDAVREYNVPGPCIPQTIMCDFKKAVLNACNTVFPEVEPSACFFHLGQSMYRRIQAEGLQVKYNDDEDPVADVSATFAMLKHEWRQEEDFTPILTYFEKTYVNGAPERGRRRAIAPRYPPPLWNQYSAATRKEHRTNNVSEAWHNRFQVVVGKHHPDLYSALQELLKEQADTEIMVAELALGRKVKSAPRKKWLDVQNRIQDITLEYQNYKDNDDVLRYLRTLSYNVTL